MFFSITLLTKNTMLNVSAGDGDARSESLVDSRAYGCQCKISTGITFQ